VATWDKAREGTVPSSMLRVVGILLGLCGVFAAAALIYGLTLIPADPAWALMISAASGLLLALIAAAFLKGGEWLVNLGLIIVSAGVSLFAGNLALMALTPNAPVDSAQAAVEMGAPFDTRTRWEVIRDLRDKGIRAYPSSPTNWLLADPRLKEQFAKLLPLGGVSRTTTVLCNESGTYTIYRSDRHGFNNDDAAHDAPGGIELLVVGDSFAHGYCVPPGEDIAGQLRGGGTNAVTVGTDGNGPLLELASLVEYGRAWRPPVVLWLLYGGNDLQDLLEERKSRALLRYLDGYSQDLVNRQGEVDSLLARIIDAEFVRHAEAEQVERVKDMRKQMSSLKTTIKQMVTLYEIRRRLSMDRQAIGAAGNEEALPLFEQVMRRAGEMVRGWGGKLYVVYLPDWLTFARPPSPSRETLLSAVRRIGLPLIDFEERLHRTGDPLAYFPFRLPNHYTAEGYRLMADQIREALAGPSS